MGSRRSLPPHLGMTVGKEDITVKVIGTLLYSCRGDRTITSTVTAGTLVENTANWLM